MTRSGNALRIVTDGLCPGAGGPGASVSRRRQTDWTGIIALANAHFVGPAFYSSLAEAEVLEELPEDVRNYLALLHHSNRQRNEALKRQANELIVALRTVDVQPMLLKGSLALFLNHYRDPGARMVCDLDILIPRRSAATVFGTLQERGYHAKVCDQGNRHSYADFTRANDPGAVDLHFELIDANYLLSAQEVWGDARIIHEGDIEFLAPSPTHCVLHHLLHAQIHHLGNFYRGVVELRQLYEFATLTRHYGNMIDWAQITDRMKHYRLEVALQSYALAAERLLALPCPLPDRPGTRAKFHYRRCIARFHSRFMDWLGVPWGNLRSSFAWHRMNDLYRREGVVLMAVRHALQYILKKKNQTIFRRLFRVR